MVINIVNEDNLTDVVRRAHREEGQRVRQEETKGPIDTSRLSSIDPRELMIADAYLSMITEGDLQELLSEHKGTDALKLLVLADAFLQYYGSETMNPELVRLLKSKDGDLRSVVGYISIANVVADGIKMINNNHVRARLLQEPEENIMPQLRRYMFIDFYLSLNTDERAKLKAIEMLKSGGSLWDIARYVSGQLTIDALCHTFESEQMREMFDRTKISDQGVLTGILFIDYFLRRIGNNTQRELVLTMVKEGKDLREVANYAMVSAALGLPVEELKSIEPILDRHAIMELSGLYQKRLMAKKYMLKLQTHVLQGLGWLTAAATVSGLGYVIYKVLEHSSTK